MSAPAEVAVYLDHAATTPVDPAVAEAMAACLRDDGVFGNPASSGHAWGRAAAGRVERARAAVAALINAPVEGVHFTSGATESINTAILGVTRFAMARDRGGHVITGATEHSATLAACRRLEQEGAQVTYLAPDTDGRVTAEAVAAALRDDTVLVSLMHVNNETGVIQPIEAVGRHLRDHAAVFHVDAAQSAGLLPLDVAMGIDLLSLSAHKFYGPKGAGVLYVRQQPRLRLDPLFYGGEQEGGLRPGTVPVHQVVGMGEAAELVVRRQEADHAHLQALTIRLLDGLQALDGVIVNGTGPRCPHILNVSFVGVHGESLALALRGPGVSVGSACTSALATPSHVLRAMGVPDALALASFRFSPGRGTTGDDVDAVLNMVADALEQQRRRSTIWAAFRAGATIDSLYRGGTRVA